MRIWLKTNRSVFKWLHYGSSVTYSFHAAQIIIDAIGDADLIIGVYSSCKSSVSCCRNHVWRHPGTAWSCKRLSGFSMYIFQHVNLSDRPHATLTRPSHLCALQTTNDKHAICFVNINKPFQSYIFMIYYFAQQHVNGWKCVSWLP